MILFRRFRRGEVIFGLALLGVLVICFVCWPALSSVNPYQSQVSNRLRSPSFIHPFGTDDFGRDVLVRVMYAGRLSLALGFMVAAFACLAGTALGLVAGFLRRLDGPISRLLDALMAFPDILLAIALLAAFGPNLVNAVIALGLVYMPRIARVVRAATLVQRELPFVEAALSMGASTGRILWVHILPNLLAPLFVQGTFVFAYAMLTEAALSFLRRGSPSGTADVRQHDSGRSALFRACRVDDDFSRPRDRSYSARSSDAWGRAPRCARPAHGPRAMR